MLKTMTGRATTVPVAMICPHGSSYPLMKRYFGFFPAPRTVLAVLAAAVGMGGVLWLLRRVPLPALVPLGAAVYGGLLWAISPASREVVTGVRR